MIFFLCWHFTWTIDLLNLKTYASCMPIITQTVAISHHKQRRVKEKNTRKIVLLEVLDAFVLYTFQGWDWTATESNWIPKGQICEDAQSASTNGRTRVATGVWRQTSLSENGSGVLHKDTTDRGNSEEEVITRRVRLPYWAFSSALSWIVLNFDCFSVTFPAKS